MVTLFPMSANLRSSKTKKLYFSAILKENVASGGRVEHAWLGPN
ncbi:hypothetical protein PVAP13_5KG546800 [Panicum virgatum]|uniref:Uncharacterized protein n=1 Tax=Panicum virgatum TaxID=38727 RepID=A0A8T0SWT3_PANVG|nr:hypothetical protein PVAP13_5KG546800 [Panicum virgatum]